MISPTRCAGYVRRLAARHEVIVPSECAEHAPCQPAAPALAGWLSSTGAHAALLGSMWTRWITSGSMYGGFEASRVSIPKRHASLNRTRPRLSLPGFLTEPAPDIWFNKGQVLRMLTDISADKRAGRHDG